jgi:bifunctional UDP-N-acetylglucosamine pyrophosphorylase / glucosamine-1-phosphate N-acetyltransferase
MSLAVLLLAAGQGARMQSKKQKILHEVGGRPMVLHAFLAATAVTNLKPVLVVAPEAEGVRNLIGDRADYVVQPEPMGTGHATLVASPLLRGQSQQVIVTYADMPLLRAETMARLATTQAESGAAVVMLAVNGDPSSTFGRVYRDEAGHVVEIIEVADARRRPEADALLAIREQNAGVYCFAADWLWSTLPSLPLRQARSGPEYYLTDMIELAVRQGHQVEAITAADVDECLGAGTRPELVAVEKAFRRRANRRWLAAGVTLIDPETTYIDADVTIGQDTVIWPNSYLQGQTVVGEDCVVGPNTILRDAQVGRGCRIEQAVVEKSIIAAAAVIGPFVHLSGVIPDKVTR